MRRNDGDDSLSEPWEKRREGLLNMIKEEKTTNRICQQKHDKRRHKVINSQKREHTEGKGRMKRLNWGNKKRR